MSGHETERLRTGYFEELGGTASDMASYVWFSCVADLVCWNVGSDRQILMPANVLYPSDQLLVATKGVKKEIQKLMVEKSNTYLLTQLLIIYVTEFVVTRQMFVLWCLRSCCVDDTVSTGVYDLFDFSGPLEYSHC